MATEAGLQVKGLNTTRKRMDLREEQICLVTEFYAKDGISWQAPRRKDCVAQQVINGETIKKTVQSRYMLMSLKVAHKLFTDKHQDPKIGISNFCELQPANIKRYLIRYHIQFVCEYHENMHLILNALESHTNLSSILDEFVSEVTCDENCKDCIYCRCDVCRNFLENFKPQTEDDNVLLKYQQWQTQDKRAEKVTIKASINAVFEDLGNQLPSFLVHRFVKRKQQVDFLKIIDDCDSTAVVLQVDFSENATLLEQNEVQFAHWTHKQVTVLTAHAWINKHVKESFAIISDYLKHTKDAVYTFMSKLFDYLVKTYSSVKLINVFSDGATSQFKQRYLFSNLYKWEKEFSINLIWNFFAMSHSKDAVDGIRGTIKRSVCRQVKANSLSPHDAKSYAEIAKDQSPNITIILVTSDEVKQIEENVPSWSRVLAVPKTQKVHCVKSKSAISLEV